MTPDEMVPELDRRFPRPNGWDLYRTATGEWRVLLRMPGVTDAANVTGATLAGAMQAALEYVPAPPPRPHQCWQHHFSTMRMGGQWQLIHVDQFVRRFATRRTAEEHAAYLVKRSDEAVSEWELRYGIAVAREVRGG